LELSPFAGIAVRTYLYINITIFKSLPSMILTHEVSRMGAILAPFYLPPRNMLYNIFENM
jgi:hypothetical protein